jgi:hypothetical protein
MQGSCWTHRFTSSQEDCCYNEYQRRAQPDSSNHCAKFVCRASFIGTSLRHKPTIQVTDAAISETYCVVLLTSLAQASCPLFGTPFRQIHHEASRRRLLLLVHCSMSKLRTSPVATFTSTKSCNNCRMSTTSASSGTCLKVSCMWSHYSDMSIPHVRGTCDFHTWHVFRTHHWHEQWQGRSTPLLCSVPS